MKKSMKHDSEYSIFIQAIKNGDIGQVTRYYKKHYLHESDGAIGPIHHACLNNHENVVEYLLEKNCDVDLPDKDGRRGSHIVASNGNVAILKQLIDHNCDLEATDNNGWRAIHYAANKGNVDVLQVLLDHRCDLEASDAKAWRPIHCAVSKGHVHILEKLINYKCDIDARPQNGMRAIHLAANIGHCNILKTLLGHNCDKEALDNNGQTAIHCAASNGHVTALQVLLQHNCNIEAEDNKGLRAIHLAANKGHLLIIQELREHNCCMEAVDHNGWRAVHLAASKGHVDIMRLLLALYCDIGATDNNGWTALHHASSNGHTDVIRFLIGQLNDIEIPTKTGWRAIHLASASGHVSVCQELISNHCDTEAEDYCGWRPVHGAAFAGHGDVMQTLIDQNINLEAKNKEGLRAIHLAANSGHLRIVKMLIDEKCDIEEADNYGNRAIHCAAINGHSAIFSLLLEHNDDMEAKIKMNGRRPSHLAAINGHANILQLLMNHNGDLNAADNNGWCPQHFAASMGHLNALNILIDGNCDLDAQTEDRWLPIHCAASNGHFSVVQVLLDHNQNIEASEKNGLRPVHHAVINGHINILQILIDYNCDLEAQTNNGWRALHYAAADGDAFILRILLNKKCNIESETNERWRPAHIAASKGHLNVLQILIDNNCDLECQTTEKLTPLSIAVRQSNLECASLLRWSFSDRKETMDICKSLKTKNAKGVLQLLKQYPLTKIVDMKTAATILDVILDRNNKDIIDVLKSKPVTEEELNDFSWNIYKILNPKSSNMIHECLLYRSIRQENGSAFHCLCSCDVVNRATLFLEATVLETIFKYNRVMYLGKVLSRLLEIPRISIESQYFEKCRIDDEMLRTISNRRRYVDLQYKDGYNRLHIAVFDNDPDMVEYILDNKYVDPYEGNKTVGTPFSHAFARKSIECIAMFEKRNLNVNTKDKKNRTPLDFAIQNGLDDFSEYLIDNIENVDARDYLGLTFLEKAVIRGCENVCEKLLKKGATSKGRINIHPHWLDFDPNLKTMVRTPCLEMITKEDTLLSLCLKVHGSIYPCLYVSLNKSQKDRNGDSLLHLSSRLLLPDVCSELLSRGVTVDSLNNCGQTPLMQTLHKYQQNIFQRGYDASNKSEEDLIRTIEILIDRGASINIVDKGVQSLLEVATSCHSEKILLTLTKRREPIECVTESELLSWFQSSYFTFLERSLDHLDIDLVKRWNTFDKINHSLEVAPITLTVAMLSRVEESVYSIMIERVLYKVVWLDDKELFSRLINTNMSRDSHLDMGESLLHCLIKDKKISYCQDVLASLNVCLLVNKVNTRNQLPLHICIENDVEELMDTLILETVDVDVEDIAGYTPVTLLLERLTEESEQDEIATTRTITHIKMLINKSASIFRINRVNRMPISYSTNAERTSEIERFNHRYRSSSQPKKESEDIICRICLDNRVNCVFECGHVFCMSCGKRVALCPMCRRLPTNPKILLL